MKYFIVLFFLILIISSCEYGTEVIPHYEEYLSIYNVNDNSILHLDDDLRRGVAKFTYDDQNILIVNNDGLWIVNPNDLNIECILDSINFNTETFSVSPIDETILIISSGDVYKFNYATKTLTNLTESLTHQCWYANYSYDGLRIVVSTRSEEGNGRIYIADNTVSNIELIYEEPSELEHLAYPTFSEDGENIFFINYDTGLTKINDDGTNAVLLKTEVGSSDPISVSGNILVCTQSYEIITYDIVSDDLFIGPEGNNPSISPDGNVIVFSDLGLYTMNSDGSNIIEIAESRTNSQFFSYDGTKIVFWHYSKYEPIEPF